MKYVRYAEIERNVWDSFINKMEKCPFNYTSDKIEFDVEYSQRIIANESFVLQEGKRILAVAAIYIEEDGEGNRQISWNGRYCLGPYIEESLNYQKQEKYGKEVAEYIDLIAEQYKCKEIWLRLDPLSNPRQSNTFYNYNFLLKYGYIDNSSLTQLIDLRKTQKDLYADIRKGHKSDIKKGQRYEIEIYDASNITEEQIELYKSIYELDAGKVTRNSELYMHYFYFIQNGLGALALAKYEEKYVAVMIVTFFQKTAYYSSYGELTEQLEGIPVGHAMQWKMMQYLKDRGIESYELGEQVFGNTHYSCQDKKLIDISNYKRGFGGYTVPFWRGRKIIETR